jgi:hypothetical protein
VVLVTALLLAWSTPTAGAASVVRVIVTPFDTSNLGLDDQWVGSAVAQLISLGLEWHPALVQLPGASVGDASLGDESLAQRARALGADAVLSGRIARTGVQLVLEPFVLHLDEGATRKTFVAPIGMVLQDLPRRVATLAASYARALNFIPTDREIARIEMAGRPTDSDRALELFVRARLDLLKHGASGHIVALLLRALQIDPDFVVARYELGTVQRALGNRWRAAEQYRTCFRQRPMMPEPYKGLADLFLEAPTPLIGAAIWAYSKAIELRPSYVDAHLGLGDARAAQGDFSEALADYRRALELNPFAAHAHLKLARLYARLGLCIQSSAAFERAVEIDPRLSLAGREACVATIP